MNRRKGQSPNPVDVHVGERVRARRALLGLTQTDLADACNITFQQVQKYERGANRVSASRLFQFSEALKVPISYFFENFAGRSGVALDAPGFADNGQDTFHADENLLNKKETLDLIREYYSIPDPKMRKDLLKMIKTMAATMRGEQK